MKKIDQQALVAQLKMGDNDAYALLYPLYYKSVHKYILNNTGSEVDAQDIFQDAIMILMDKLKAANFVLTSSVGTYLFAVSRNLWLKQLRSKSLESTIEQSCFDDGKTLTTDEIDAEEQQEGKVAYLMSLITKNCKQILDFLFFKNQSIDTLMGVMGWKNKHTANNQKYKCIQQAKKAASIND